MKVAVQLLVFPILLATVGTTPIHTARTTPFSPAIRPVGTVQAHGRTHSGVVLVSTECLPTYSLRLPDGSLTQDQVDAYVATHRTDLQATPCARPTELQSVSMRGAGVDVGHFAEAQSAYDAALDHGASEATAIAAAISGYDGSSTLSSRVVGSSISRLALYGPGTRAVAGPHVPLACDGGNWYQENHDTVNSPNGNVWAHIDWQLWYAVASGNGCTHFFQQNKFVPIDGNTGSTWFQWSEISDGSNLSSPYAKDGDWGNTGAAINIPTTQNYNNQSTTSTGYMEADTSYCIANPGGCAIGVGHYGDYIVH